MKRRKRFKAKLRDLEVIEQAVSRLEPEGKEAWKEYLSLKNSIRRENNPDRKERLMAEALELGRKYGF
ncbi:MAG: hypothetical protein GY841_13555 [FCB group bacterium]|nr:hypothetical protein [FCB group bacterium]